MKPATTLLLLATLTACDSASPPVTSESPSAAAAADGSTPAFAAEPAAARSRTEDTVIFQGLIAFVERSDGDGNPTLEALLVDALPAPDASAAADAHHEAAPAKVPRVLTSQTIRSHRLFLPAHEPFVAVQNGTIAGESCFIDQARPTTFQLTWENSLNITAYPLCSTPPCGDLNLSLGNSKFAPENVDLEALVDASDLDASCGEDYFKLKEGYEQSLAARIHVLRGTAVDAEILHCTSSVGTLSLSAGSESECEKPAAVRTFAEQVAVTGDLPITLEWNGKACTFDRETAERPLVVWIFSAHADSYKPGVAPTPHPAAFYWYYDLVAPSPCTAGSPQKYLRPCPDDQQTCAADPKCPQPRMVP